MACAECDEAGRDSGRWDEEGCIDGTVYGYCWASLEDPEINCYGMCESYGPCDCECHKN